MEGMVRFEDEWSTFNLHSRSISGDILPSNLRLEVGTALGHYNKQRDIQMPLLNQKKLKENMNKVNGLSPAITDIIIVRNVGLSLLENINKTIDNILEKLEIEYKLKTKSY